MNDWTPDIVEKLRNFVQEWQKVPAHCEYIYGQNLGTETEVTIKTTDLLEAADEIERLLEMLRAEAPWQARCASYQDEVAEKDAEIERLKELAKWQPIETAPRDGTWIIVTEETGTYMEFVRWYEGSWCAFPQTIFGEGSGELPASDWCPNLEPPYQGLLDDDPEEGE